MRVEELQERLQNGGDGSGDTSLTPKTDRKLCNVVGIYGSFYGMKWSCGDTFEIPLCCSSVNSFLGSQRTDSIISYNFEQSVDFLNNFICTPTPLLPNGSLKMP